MATLARLRDPASLADAPRSRPPLANMMTTHFTEINSPIGLLSLRGTPRGLTGIFMETHRHGPAEAERLGWQRDDELFAEARAQLAEYFAGRRQIFTLT